LLDRDSARRRYVYEVVDGPLPVATSRGALGVDDGPNDDSIVRWTIELRTSGSTGSQAGAVEADVRQFLETGLDALVRHVLEGVEST
jgi:hypothetical protein